MRDGGLRRRSGDCESISRQAIRNREVKVDGNRALIQRVADRHFTAEDLRTEILDRLVQVVGLQLAPTASPPTPRDPNHRLPAIISGSKSLSRRAESGAKRKITVEPVFGNLKANLRFRRFSRRSLPAVTSEWRLICATHNLLKLRTHQMAIA